MLSAAQRQEVVRLYEELLPQAEIARKLGIHPTTVRAIMRERGLVRKRIPRRTVGKKRCVVCGTVFAGWSNAHYCSLECYRKAKGLTERVCPVCGKPFQPKWKRQVTCGHPCAAVYRDAREGQYTIRCMRCGKEFHARSKRIRYCCDECREAKHGEWNHQRRRIGSDGHWISAQEIYKRDRWICQLCGKRVDRKLTSPHPMSATLDHIIPLSEGGSHTPENVQLAHRTCNNHKGNRIWGSGEQLLLYGRLPISTSVADE